MTPPWIAYPETWWLCCGVVLALFPQWIVWRYGQGDRDE